MAKKILIQKNPNQFVAIFTNLGKEINSAEIISFESEKEITIADLEFSYKSMNEESINLRKRIKVLNGMVPLNNNQDWENFSKELYKIGGENNREGVLLMQNYLRKWVSKFDDVKSTIFEHWSDVIKSFGSEEYRVVS